MILITGGAFQGKAAYAADVLGFPADKIIAHAELAIRELLAQGKDPVAEIAALADAWTDCAVLLEDICGGVVPMDAQDRAWREAVGRCGTYLARRATRVVRVFCGIGTVIKDA